MKSFTSFGGYGRASSLDVLVSRALGLVISVLAIFPVVRSQTRTAQEDSAPPVVGRVVIFFHLRRAQTFAR